jgi:argininosuccinate lyase
MSENLVYRKATALSEQLWGGRFRSPADPSLLALSRSPDSYFRMSAYDLAGSRSHVRELLRAEIVDEVEAERLLAEIDTLDEDVRAGRVGPNASDEDVHTFLERVLVERLGEVGGKLRAGRSRNDQTANDLRLYLRDHARKLVLALAELQDSLVEQGRRHVRTAAPGFTHLQPAQPIVFGHQLLAHAQAFARDADRLADWDRRTARSPLGSAALAGSAIAVHPELSAAELSYDGPCENSIDAVASRDHVAEFLFAASMLGVNLSRLAEEICTWASRQFRWVELHDSFATGSSIMPQKKNPDIAELTRGKAGRLLGNLNGLMATLKAMPLAYNRDLAEDKAAVFDTVDTLVIVLPAMAGLVRTLSVNVDELRRQATEGFTLATEAADWLSRRGVPFSEAHEITGVLVRTCEDKGLDLHELSDAELAAVDARLTPDVRPHLTVEAALAARSGYGATSPDRVLEQIDRLADLLARQRAWARDYQGPAT